MEVKNRFHYRLLAAGMAAALLAFGSCGQDSGSMGNGQGAASGGITPPAGDKVQAAANIPTGMLLPDEKDQDTSEDGAVEISLDGDGISTNAKNGVSVDGSVLTIFSAGTYLLSGSLGDGEIRIEADKEEEVHLIFDGISISHSDGPAIYGKSGKITITLKDGTSSRLLDGAEYSGYGAEENPPTACLYSQDDLTINGDGALDVQVACRDGITSKDDLKLVSGNISITAADDGIVGHDSLEIFGGKISVKASGDGMKSSNDTKEGKGYIYIGGGELEVLAGDDGIHANGTVAISGGDIVVSKSYEGIEGKSVQISGGSIHVYSSDDGVNAADGESSQAWGRGMGQVSTDILISITGGYLYVNADGDGLDSNGNIMMTGGVCIVDGPENSGNSALDYEGSFTMDGGVLIAAGSAGMAQAPSGGGQCYLSMAYRSNQAAGSLIRVADGEGNGIITYSPAKKYSNIVISSPELKEGGNYQLYIGGRAGDSMQDGLYPEDTTYSDGTLVAGFTILGTANYFDESGEAAGNQGGFGGGHKGPGGFDGFDKENGRPEDGRDKDRRPPE